MASIAVVDLSHPHEVLGVLVGSAAPVVVLDQYQIIFVAA
jgi:hypothetical protein